MQDYKYMRLLAKWKWLIITAILLVAGLVILSRYGYVTVEVSQLSSGQDVTYTLTKGDKSKVVTSSSGTFRRLLPKATYELKVTQGKKSAFSIIKSRGFLANTASSLALEGERGRTFVGQDPESCMYTQRGVLYSYSCQDSFSNLSIHHPGTKNQPSYVTKNLAGFSGSLEGVIKTKEGLIAAINYPQIGEDVGAPHTTYILQNGIETTSPAPAAKPSPPSSRPTKPS